MIIAESLEDMSQQASDKPQNVVLHEFTAEKMHTDPSGDTNIAPHERRTKGCQIETHMLSTYEQMHANL